MASVRVSVRVSFRVSDSVRVRVSVRARAQVSVRVSARARVGVSVSVSVGCFGYCVLGVRCDVRCSMRDVLGVMFYVLRIRPYALCVMRSELAVRC